MNKFCFCIPLVESGVIVGVYGSLVWILYSIQTFFERNLDSEDIRIELFINDNL